MFSWNSIFKELKDQMEQSERKKSPYPAITSQVSRLPTFVHKLGSNTLEEKDLINFIIDWRDQFYTQYKTYPKIIIGTSEIELGKDRTRRLREPKDWIEDILSGLNYY